MFSISEKIKSNEFALFAYKVWRVPYVIGALAVFYFAVAGASGILISEGFIKGVFSIIFFIAVWLIVWTIASGAIFLLAFIGKKFSRRYPFLIFIFLPLPISLISLFIFYRIALMPKEELAGLVFFIALFVASIVLVPINLISWGYAVSDYRRTLEIFPELRSSARQKAAFLFPLLLSFLGIVILTKNTMQKDLDLPGKSTLKAITFSGVHTKDDFILLRYPPKTLQVVYQIQKSQKEESELFDLGNHTSFNVPLSKIDAVAYTLEGDKLFLFERKDLIVRGVLLDRHNNSLQNLENFTAYSNQKTIQWVQLDAERVYFSGIGYINDSGKLISLSMKPLYIYSGEFSQWNNVFCNTEQEKPPISINKEKFIGPQEEFRGGINKEVFECLAKQALEIVYIKERAKDDFGKVLFLGLNKNIDGEPKTFNYEISGKADDFLATIAHKTIVGLNSDKPAIPQKNIYSPNQEMYYTLSMIEYSWDSDFTTDYVVVSLFDKNHNKLGEYFVSERPGSVKNIGWSPNSDYILLEHNKKVLQIILP